MKDKISLLPGEKVKYIKGYSMRYSITSYGRVWRCERSIPLGRWAERILKGMFLREEYSNNGILKVSLFLDNISKRFRLDFLVAEHFLNNSYNYPYLRHKDLNQQNCRMDNLVWSERDCSKVKPKLKNLIRDPGVVCKYPKKIILKRIDPKYVPEDLKISCTLYDFPKLQKEKEDILAEEEKKEWNELLLSSFCKN